MGPERALLSIEAWIPRRRGQMENSKFEKVETLAFKKFETFIILCVALRDRCEQSGRGTIGREPSNQGDPSESSVVGENGDSEAAETRSGMENPPVADDNDVTTRAMTQFAEDMPLELPRNLRCRRTCGRR